MSYINPYTGKKYKNLSELKYTIKDKDYPGWISEEQFKNIIKKFKR